MRKFSKKRRKIQNVRMQVLIPKILEMYIFQSIRESRGCLPFCARCGESAFPGDLEPDEVKGRRDTENGLHGTLDPTNIQMLHAECHRVGKDNKTEYKGGHVHFLKKNNAELYGQHVDLLHKILSFLPEKPPMMRWRDEDVREAIIRACE